MSGQSAVGGTFVAIIQTAKDFSADLLLIEPCRRSLVKDVIVDTTAERAIRTSSTPVLMDIGTQGPTGLHEGAIREHGQRALRSATFDVLAVPPAAV